ncbi:hypothetical protein BYT27DRAFT_7185559 [Phlegmacium glaucopus]|nr:hypothetical protein BYT27DRAFT_7185559 [Phlegmacium glaucopus]
MSVQIFPAEILDLFLDELALATEDPQSRAALLACTRVNRQFYYQASPYICSSLMISTQKRLDALLDILNANPDISRHIRSFTFFFAKTRPETLPGSLLPSLRRLRISLPLSNDEEAEIIMTHAAPTLTTLILCDPPNYGVRFSLKFKSTIVFPVLESIQVSFNMYRYNPNPVPMFLSQFLEHCTPMLTRIQIQIISDDRHTLPRIQQPLTEGFLPIDKILSSPRHRALKTLDVVFVDIYSPLLSSLEVQAMLNEIFPAALFRSQIEIKITTDSLRPLYTRIEVHFVF